MLIYKVLRTEEWAALQAAGRTDGAPVDVTDGYIHFSTAVQAKETASRHFAGVDDLLLVAVDADLLGTALSYEPSRGGDLFPHLYDTLPLSAVRSVDPLPIGPDGHHVFPASIGEGIPA